MQVTQSVFTIGASAAAFPAASNGQQISKLHVVPLRSNTHVSYVGISTVTGDASGVGVIKEIAQPPAATVPTDAFVVEDQGGDNTIDPTQFYGHGTSGEKMLVTYFQR